MDEEPATPIIDEHENAELMTSMQKRLEGKPAPYLVFARLLLVFACGLLLGFLTGSLLPSVLDATTFPYPSWLIWLGPEGSTAIILLFPPLLGIAVAFIRDRRSKPLISRGLGRGLLAWAGMLIYWLIFYSYIDAVLNKAAIEACARVNNHGFCGLSLVPFGVIIYLIYAGVFVLLGAVFTSLSIKLTHR